MNQAKQENSSNANPTQYTKNIPISKFQEFALKLINMLSFLFFGETKKMTTRMLEKRNLKKHYKRLGVNFLDVSIEKVSPQFAIYVYEIFQLLQLVRGLFGDALRSLNDLEHKKINTEEMFFVDYITSLLQTSDKMTLQKIQDPIFFKEIISHENDPKQAFDDHLEKTFAEIQKGNTQKAHEHLYCFNKLLVLARFDFQSFFIPFDRQFRNVSGYKPIFHSIFGESAGKHLISLNTYLRFIDFTVIAPEVIQHFYKELEFFNKKCAESPDLAEHKRMDAKNIAEGILRLVKKIAFLNQSNVIEIMIQFLTHNLDYNVQLKDQDSQKNFLFARYIQLLKVKIRRSFLESYDQIQEQLIKQEMLKLLNIQSWDELDVLPNYNSTIQQALLSKGLSGFSYLFLTIFIKNFFQRIYEPLIKRVINVLLLKGKFFSKADQKDLTEHFYNLEVVRQQFEGMQQDFNTGELYMRDIVRFATAKRIDLSMKNLVSRYISKIEDQIENIVREMLKMCTFIVAFLETVCRDWDTADGAILIQNIREIDGIKNEMFYSELTSATESLKTFLELVTRLPSLQLFKS